MDATKLQKIREAAEVAMCAEFHCHRGHPQDHLKNFKQLASPAAVLELISEVERLRYAHEKCGASLRVTDFSDKDLP